MSVSTATQDIREIAQALRDAERSAPPVFAVHLSTGMLVGTREEVLLAVTAIADAVRETKGA